MTVSVDEAHGALNQTSEGETIMERDPVCGMEINERESVASERFRDKVYRFCSFTCRDAFHAEPDRYVKSGEDLYRNHLMSRGGSIS